MNDFNLVTDISIILNVLFMGVAMIVLLNKGGWFYLKTKLTGLIKPQINDFDNPNYPYYIHKNSQFTVITNQENIEQNNIGTNGMKIKSACSKIIFLGDSITDEGEWVELLANPHVLNRGISGDTTVRISKRLDNIIATQPEKIFLMIGVNDLINTKRNIQEIAQEYQKIVTKLIKKLPTTQIFIQSILPVNNQIFIFWQDNQNIIKLNQEIQAIATQHNLPYIDIFSYLCDNQNQLDRKYTSDGLHLNGQAYLVWSEILKKLV